MDAPDSVPFSDRLIFSRFTEDDAEGLAAVLSDPEVTRSITAKATTPDQCLASARKRIGWHNAAWETDGYGVWALRERNGPEPRPIIGWCGFAEPDVGTDPEILYGLSRSTWGNGLATEGATAAIDWLCDNDVADGISAIIFARLNPGSVAVTKKLGMVRRGTMDFADFLPDPVLARDVLDYEIWRMQHGACIDPKAMLFQAPYKAGQIVSIGTADRDETEAALCTAALARPNFGDGDESEIRVTIADAFRLGLNETTMDWYHVSRSQWQKL